MFQFLINNVSIFQLNVFGALEAKLELIEFVNYIKRHEIILLSECWINEHSVIDIEGYKCFKKIRKMKRRAKRPSGGLICYIKESLFKGVETVNFDFEDGMCLRLKGNFFGWDSDLYILHVYLRGENSSRNDLSDDLCPSTNYLIY